MLKKRSDSLFKPRDKAAAAAIAASGAAVPVPISDLKPSRAGRLIVRNVPWNVSSFDRGLCLGAMSAFYAMRLIQRFEVGMIEYIMKKTCGVGDSDRKGEKRVHNVEQGSCLHDKAYANIPSYPPISLL